MQLDNLNLTSNEGAVLWLKNKKAVEIEALDGTASNLSVTACADTAANKAAVIWAKGKLHFTGKGALNILATGDGCKGINAKGNIKLDDITLSVITEGNNLGKEKGGFGDGMPFGGMPFGEMPEGMPQMPEGFGPPQGMGGFLGDMGGFPGGMGGGFPEGMGGFPGGMGGPGGFPGGSGGFPEGMPMNFDGKAMQSGDPDEKKKSEFKQRYVSPTKGIKSLGTFTVNSGSVYCKTSSYGAEGIEAKKGITINGGTVIVDAIDDAINANGQIVFNGGKVIAESHCNDAVDANIEGGFNPFGGFGMFGNQGKNQEDDGKQKESGKQKPAIVISGGEVYAYSHVGTPEEGLDCDFAPIEISGGKVFTIGAGMGEMPSVPTEDTARQVTVLFTGLNLVKDTALEILDSKEVVYSVLVPFNFSNSSSVVSFSNLQKNKKYTLKTEGTKKNFKLKNNFEIIRL